MRSLKRRFNNVTKKNPYWSSYTCFVEAIKKQEFNKQTIHRWFNKLVKKDDYDRKDKRALFFHLRDLTNNLDDNQF